VLSDITSRGKLAILDATAPYYLKALIYGIDRGPGPQPAFREAMSGRPLHELYAELRAADPVSAARVGPGDRKRLIRALEIIRFGNKLPSEVPKWAEPRPDYRWVLTGISWQREALNTRVEARTRAMFEAGWLDEVRRIRESTGFSRTAGMAHGYRRLQQHLDGAISLGEAVELTIRDVRQFARKSMTFFRSFPKVQWLEVASEEEIDRAAAYLSNEMREFMKPTHKHEAGAP
jgi:tRNA dimethylallyltransferase